MDQVTYEAAKSVLETELAESTDEREIQRITRALEDIKKLYEASSNA